MGFDRIEAVSLTDQFVQKIESMIISGELMPGDQLPPARELSARMGVSRPVISAGLIELEKMGFVEIVARQGVYVSDYRKTGSLDTLTALLNYNGGVMRDDEVRSLDRCLTNYYNKDIFPTGTHRACAVWPEVCAFSGKLRSATGPGG